jgi:peptidyl-prolyl cis-trans isomerase A (cyclophilin A)
MKRLLLSAILLLLAVPAWAGPSVVMKTSLGNITIELDAAKAPVTVKNFLAYVDAGAYAGTIFHRVIDGFMIQGGGFDADLQRRPSRAPIKNEAGNGLPNRRGTIAMARTSVVDSATNQFFINLKDNAFLDHQGEDARRFGYAVFGRVTAGMEVVDRIAKVPTRARNGQFQNLPVEPVTILAVERVQP